MICEKNKCSGCLACMNVCPKNAIYVEVTSRGNTIAAIDYSKCINCGLCKKICPSNNKVRSVSPKICYAAQWKNNKRMFSASGGIATAISEYALNSGIHIFASVFDDRLNLVIRELVSSEDVRNASGSKYIQSSTGNSYRDVKRYLQNDESVVFIGTPCQVSGLLGFLSRKYDKLITIDIVCHGVPPFKYFEDYIHDIKMEKATSATFRGEDDYYLCLFNDKRLIYHKWHNKDYYYLAYDEGIINRDNCYECDYANDKRVSDITLGDFWGLDKSTLKNRYYGKISVVLLNTDKGEECWNSIKDMFVHEERSVEEAIKGNPHLKKCNPATEKSEIFHDNYEKYGFVSAIKKTGIRKRMIRLWIREMKKYLFR